MFEIANRKIGINFPPYIIAELSANHNGSIERAKLSIKAAKDSGADAIKLQTYTPDTMTIDCSKSDFLIKDGLWSGYKLYDLYKDAHTPFEWHEELFSYAKEIGITIFSSPFDESAVDLLEELNCPAYKIASFEVTDLPLIRYIAKKKKPMLISTGMANEAEIREAVETAKSNGCNSLLLFHCISSYPAPIEQANLIQIQNIKKEFNVSVGLSDHTIGSIASVVAVSLGACAIEKHFTISRLQVGPDSSFSMEPEELKQLINDTNSAWLSIGKNGFNIASSENSSKVFRRSLYFVSDLKAGEVILPNHIRRIRPGFGLAPKYFSNIIGKVVTKDITRGDSVSWDCLEDQPERE